MALDDVPLVTPDTPLPEAAALLAAAEWEELPVVRSATDRRPCGIISRQQVLRASVVGVAFPDRE